MIGARIGALRREAGMSQTQLAGLLGVSPSAVGMYEQGRREPSAQLLVELSRIFHVSVDYILTGSPAEQETLKVEQMLCRRITSADRRLEQRPDRPFSRQELAVLFAALLLEQ